MCKLQIFHFRRFIEKPSPSLTLVPLPKTQELQAPKASKQHALIASTALVALAAASPAHAGDLFGPEYSGVIGNVVLFIVGGIGAVSALFLPIICGTLNPVQIAVNLGLVEGEVSNLRKFKRNGEPMDHGVKFGHKWYDTDAVRAGAFPNPDTVSSPAGDYLRCTTCNTSRLFAHTRLTSSFFAISTATGSTSIFAAPSKRARRRKGNRRRRTRTEYFCASS